MKNSFIVNLTHDIDRVQKSFQYITHDIFRGKFKNLRSLFSTNDPYWTFEDIMKIEDDFGVRSTFFFLQESIPLNIFSTKSWLLTLGRYNFSNENVRKIIKRLDKYGWEIGLHGSYNSYQNYDLLFNEKAELEKVLGKEVVGIRQHYLKLNKPLTWQIQRKAGFLYDASFGYLGKVGFPDNKFRPFIDNDSGQFIIPLAIMDCYLFGAVNNDRKKAFNFAKKIIDEAEQNNAVLSIVWHNREFNEDEFPGYREVYIKILNECKNRNATFLTCKDIYDKNKQNNE